MDPFSLATGIAGLISLTKDVHEVIQPYVRDVASAANDISQLQLQVRALGEVLGKLKSLLESEDADELLFESDSALELVRRNCQGKLTDIYKRLKRKKTVQPKSVEMVAVIRTRALPAGSSAQPQITQEPATVGLLDRLIWPFQKSEVLASCAKMQEYIQTFGFCLSIANCKTLSKSSKLVVKMLQEQESQLSAVAHIISPVPEQIAQTLKQLEGVVAAVTAVTQELHGISAEIQVVTAEVERKKFEEILQWVSPNHTGKRHEAFREVRTVGTCREFFDLASFKAWIRNDPAHRVLCCVGAPGVGKSILCSAVVDELCGPSGRYPLCYHYFEYQTQGSQTTVAVMRQLLRQLLESTKKIPDDLKLVYDTVGRRSKAPTVEEAVTFISRISGQFDQVYVCIDGLDECENLTQLLNTLAMWPNNTRIFLSGRKGVETVAQRQFPQPTVLDIQAQDKDVRLFLTHEIRQNMRRYPELMDMNLEGEIVSHLAESSGGLFLLASLHVANILAEPTKRKRREVLNKPPKNLHEVYNSTIKRILDHGKAKADQAMEVLAWVYLAERPLSLTELRHGLATEIDDPDFDSDNLPADSFLSECLGLVQLDAETGLVRLVHLSLLEFFESEGTLQRFQETLANKCLTYILFDSTAVELTGNWLRNWDFRHLLWGEETEATNLPSLIIRFPLLKYASCYWGDHARKSGLTSQEGRDRMRKYILLPGEKMQPSVACFMAGPLVSKLQHYVPLFGKNDGSEQESNSGIEDSDRDAGEDRRDGGNAGNSQNDIESQSVAQDSFDFTRGRSSRKRKYSASPPGTRFPPQTDIPPSPLSRFGMRDFSPDTRSPSPSPYRDPMIRWQWRQWEPPRAHILAFFGLSKLWGDGDAKFMVSLDLHASDGWQLRQQNDAFKGVFKDDQPPVLYVLEGRPPVSYALLRGDTPTVEWILSQHHQQDWRSFSWPCSCTLWRNIATELDHNVIARLLLQCRDSFKP